MKKLLTLLVILGMGTTVYGAGIIDLKVNGEAYTGQDVQGSDIITINWMETTENPGSFGYGFRLDVDHGDYVADTFRLHPGGALGTLSADYPIDDGFAVTGNTTYFPGTPGPIDGIMFTLDFHVPGDLEASTYINLSPQGAYGGMDTSSLATRLHVIPEPCPCLGDLNGDNDQDLDDLIDLVGLLKKAKFFTGQYLIQPADADWNPCGDMDGDDDIDLDDLIDLVGALKKCKFFTGQYVCPCE